MRAHRFLIDIICRIVHNCVPGLAKFQSDAFLHWNFLWDEGRCQQPCQSYLGMVVWQVRNQPIRHKLVMLSVCNRLLNDLIKEQNFSEALPSRIFHPCCHLLPPHGRQQCGENLQLWSLFENLAQVGFDIKLTLPILVIALCFNGAGIGGQQVLPSAPPS